MEEKKLTEQESIALIAEMISKAQNHYHENGNGTILWGCVIAICSFVTSASLMYGFSLPFDIWLLTFVAVIPTVYFVIKEKRLIKVKTYQQSAIDYVWIVFYITIVAIILYANITHWIAPKMLAEQHLTIIAKNTVTGEEKPYRIFPPNFSALMMMVYAIPTLITGLISGYKPLIIGSVACYLCFLISLFTKVQYDFLLQGIAVVFCWLIPGLMLRKKFLQKKALSHNV